MTIFLCVQNNGTVVWYHRYRVDLTPPTPPTPTHHYHHPPTHPDKMAAILADDIFKWIFFNKNDKVAIFIEICSFQESN